VVARVVLGSFAVLAVVGGAMFTEVGGWSSVAGAIAVGLYAGGMVAANPAVRVLAGVAAGFVGFSVTSSAAMMAGVVAGSSGPRGDVEKAVFSFIWIAAGVFFVWVAVKGRWPVSATRG